MSGYETLRDMTEHVRRSEEIGVPVPGRSSSLLFQSPNSWSPRLYSLGSPFVSVPGSFHLSTSLLSSSHVQEREEPEEEEDIQDISGRGRAVLDSPLRTERSSHQHTSGTSHRQVYHRGETVFAGFLHGQIGNVLKTGVWWILLGPLALAFFHNSPLGIGLTRAIFNISLLFISPVAGLVASRVPVRKLLLLTSLGRALIYVIAFPLLWLLLESNWLLQPSSWAHSVFLASFLLLMFVDGVIVSFGNVADIDCGGTDLVAEQYHLHLLNQKRDHLNALHESWFDAAMIVVAPVVAGSAALLAAHLPWPAERGNHGLSTEALTSTAALLLVLSGIFLLCTFISIVSYVRALPVQTPEVAAPKPRSAPISSIMYMSPQLAPTVPATPLTRITRAECRSILVNLVEGGKLAWRAPAIRWRLLFLALETSFEDAMISLLVTFFATQQQHRTDANVNFSATALGSAAVLACGKLAAVIATALMRRFWRLRDGSNLHGLFALVLLSAFSTLLLPWAWSLRNHHHITASWAVVGASAVLFFLCSAPPKIGFASLLQRLASRHDPTGRVFGFVAAFLVSCDALVLLLLSCLFTWVNMQTSLWIWAGVVTLHGVLQMLWGPSLVLRPAKQALLGSKRRRRKSQHKQVHGVGERQGTEPYQSQL